MKSPKELLNSILGGPGPPSEEALREAIVQQMGKEYADKFFTIIEASKKMGTEELQEVFKDLVEIAKEAIMTIQERNHVDYYVGIMNGMILKAQSNQEKFNNVLWNRLAKVWGIDEQE